MSNKVIAFPTSATQKEETLDEFFENLKTMLQDHKFTPRSGILVLSCDTEDQGYAFFIAGMNPNTKLEQLGLLEFAKANIMFAND